MFSSQHSISSLAGLATIVLCLSVGCSKSGGPGLGYVEGVITLDDKPLDGAEVSFEPEGGRPSIAFTDNEGHYVLMFTGSQEGAVIGKHTVRILSARGASGGEGDEPKVESRPELLPARYNVDSELTVEVKSGSNQCDFDLTSK